MQKARYIVALSCAYAGAGCSTEIAQAVYSRPPDAPDAGPPVIPEKPPVCTSAKITDRLSYGGVLVNEGVRYKRVGLFFGFPQDDRIAFSTLSNNGSLVAWLNSGATQVHVTQLTPEFNRVGNDVLVDGTELSGLVALDDGFAVLTRRFDPGDPIGDTAQPQATYLVRWQNGRELFAVPLTGTKSIAVAPDNEKRDFPLSNPGIGLSGRLAYNGLVYGAYFGVRGGSGDRYFNINSDKFVQVDDTGVFVGGWRSGCRQNLGVRLIPERDDFVAFCMSDGYGGLAGLNIAQGSRNTTRLAPESTSSSGGYLGGNLGSAVKVADGYLVAWASRGVNNGSVDNPAFDLHEPAVARADKDRNPVPYPKWPFLPDTTKPPTRDAVNVHAAPYGDKVLLVWETIESPRFGSTNGYSTGTYGGTHFRLVDAQGKTASDEEFLPEARAPNGPDDIVQFPNGDLGWAYVPEERNFQMILAATTVPSLPIISDIRFVRLQYCTP